MAVTIHSALVSEALLGHVLGTGWGRGAAENKAGLGPALMGLFSCMNVSHTVPGLCVTSFHLG